jgi:mRNA-degrading endonuclease RelE of RelBE toxin-antitoxin system
VTFQVFLSEKAQRDLDSFPDKIVNQILTDCARLAGNPIPDGKRIKKLQGFKEALYRLGAGDYRVVFKRSGSRLDSVRILSKPDFQKAY